MWEVEFKMSKIITGSSIGIEQQNCREDENVGVKGAK